MPIYNMKRAVIPLLGIHISEVVWLLRETTEMHKIWFLCYFIWWCLPFLGSYVPTNVWVYSLKCAANAGLWMNSAPTSRGEFSGLRWRAFLPLKWTVAPVQSSCTSPHPGLNPPPSLSSRRHGAPYRWPPDPANYRKWGQPAPTIASCWEQPSAR